MKRLLCLTLSVIILLTVVPLVPSSFAASDWSDWVSELPSGDYEYETKTQYRYRDKIVTGTQWKKTGSGSEEYVKAWPPGFDRSHSYYSRFNKTISNWETSTSKRVYEDEHEIWYIKIVSLPAVLQLDNQSHLIKPVMWKSTENPLRLVCL